MKQTLFILLLSGHFCFAQPGTDSLQNLLKAQNLSIENRIDAINELAFRFRRTNPLHSLDLVTQSLELSKQHKYQYGEGKANVVLSSYYYLRSDYTKSLETAFTALRIFEKTAYQKEKADTYILLALTYNSIQEREKAKQYLDKSLSIALAINYNEGIVRVYKSEGDRLVGTNKKEAEEFYRKALEYLTDNSSYLKVDVMANLAELILYRAMYSESFQLLDKALSIGEAQRNKEGLILVHSTLGEYYNATKQFSKAEEQYLIAKKLAAETGHRKKLLTVYINLISLSTKLGRTNEAHIYQMKYLKERDSIFNLEKVQQIAELETKYETEKKEQRIQLLEQEKKTEFILRNSLIGGVALTIISAFIIFLLQRSRTRKTNQLLEAEQMMNDKLKELDKIRSQFFTNISHEFRTPLTLIVAPLEEVFKKFQLSEEQKVPLMIIKRNANRLLELINQLMDLSKLEAGKMELRVKEGKLQSFLQVVATSFDSWAEHKEIHFIKSIEIPDQPNWFDQDKLEKIITNLLSNAFKFTPSTGSVTINCLAREREGKNFLFIQITDTGVGIPEEEQKVIFLPFFQSTQAQQIQYTGTGIGLSLVMELVKLYGGHITLDSKVGKGTTFFVEIPIDKSAFSTQQMNKLYSTDMVNYSVPLDDNHATLNDPIDNPQVESEAKDSVLVVEDNADMRNFIASILTDFSVFMAGDGLEALEVATQVIPSLVITDLMMPRMDGILLTEKLKSDERTSHIPVIILTAKNEPITRMEGLKTGADDYLTKPFLAEEILIRISNLIEQRKKLALKFQERVLTSRARAIAEVTLDDKFLSKCRSVVESHIGDFSFSVELMADEMILSRTQLLRKVRALTRLSTNEFIKDVRLKRAAEMISLRLDSITQIGYSVGFSDQSYFTKCFKNKFGMTPTEYAVKNGPSRANDNKNDS